MSTYVISDIHGCFAEFKQLLSAIRFSDDDELFVLGDVCDRGPEPIALLRFMMEKPNIFLVKGNHDYTALKILRRLGVEITEESISQMNEKVVKTYLTWIDPDNGGAVTLRQFMELTPDEREDVLLYLEEADDYEMLDIGGKLYILVHAGLDNFAPDKELEEYRLRDILWTRPDYSKCYYPGGRIFLVTGHTPTPLIREDKLPLVYENEGHIAIDCGCCFGGRLAAYCLETGQVTYVDSEKLREEWRG